MRANLRIFCLVLFLSTFFMQVQVCLSFTPNSDVENSKSSKKIAIAAVSDSATSQISKRAGRAPYYLVFDGNGLFLKSLINPSKNRGRRASSGVVDLLIKESVKTVIAGKFGDKMKKLLETNNIEYHEHTGIAQDVVGTIVKNKRSKNVQE